MNLKVRIPGKYKDGITQRFSEQGFERKGFLSIKNVPCPLCTDFSGTACTKCPFKRFGLQSVDELGLGVDGCIQWIRTVMGCAPLEYGVVLTSSVVVFEYDREQEALAWFKKFREKLDKLIIWT